MFSHRTPALACTVALFAAASTPAALAQVAVGDTPDFTFNRLDNGEEVNPITHEGELVILDFWATWCGPCVASMPHMEQLYTTYHEYGVEVYGLSLDQTPDVVETFVESNKTPWPVSQGEGPNLMASDFGVTGIPACFILGPDGAVLWTGHPMTLTDDMLGGLVEEHLGVDVPSASERAQAALNQANAALNASDLDALMEHVRQLGNQNLDNLDEPVLNDVKALYARVASELDREALSEAVSDDETRLAWVKLYRVVRASDSTPDAEPQQESAAQLVH